MKTDDNGGKAPHSKPDSLPPSEEEKAKILSIVLERMVMIDGKVYGLEDETEPAAEVGCEARIKSCRAVCCTYAFALTQEEAGKGFIKYNAERPFYIPGTRMDTARTSIVRPSSAASMTNGPCGAENMLANKEQADRIIIRRRTG